MGAFNLADALNLKPVSKLDTAETKVIEVSLLDPNPNNFFPVEEDITDLVESIKLNGLLQPPVVTPAGSRYRIIAGHRRHKALQVLAAELPDKFGTVLCRIVRPSSPELEELMLIQTNTEAREVGYKEKNEAAARVTKILISLQNQGVSLPGKMRKYVAQILKTSESQLARAKYISEHLIEPFRARQGMSDSLAYKLAHLPAEQQQELHDHYKSEPWGINVNSVDRYLDNISNGRPPFETAMPMRDCYVREKEGNKYLKCDHVVCMEDRKKRDDLKDWQKCRHYYCCNHCEYRFECEDLCCHCASNVRKKQSEEYFAVGQRLKAAREAMGLSIDDVVEMVEVGSEFSILKMETVSEPDLDELMELCRLYHTTPNAILGFETLAPQPQIGNMQFPEWIPADQIDDLPDGFYTLAYYYRENAMKGAEGLTLIHTRLALLEGDYWYSAMGKMPICFSVVSKEVLVAVAPACIAAPTGFTFFLGGASYDGM